MNSWNALEICAGGGGQSLGLEQAGFQLAAAVEIEPIACETLRTNRPEWDVIEADVRDFDGSSYQGVDLLAGGVPCPPFSIAGKQLGADDERDLFPTALRLTQELRPAAVMLENVRGFSMPAFDGYRKNLFSEFEALGYQVQAKVLNSSNFGVPQLRPRWIMVALQTPLMRQFRWPDARIAPLSVGESLHDLMAVDGWPGADEWAARADRIAPTLVGGSRKHGGPDLGPTRARDQWRKLGVEGRSLADAPPGPDFPRDGLPRLTIEMVARIQGFPEDWKFAGRKTAAYRQVGNALPPPVAREVACSIHAALDGIVLQRLAPPALAIAAGGD